MGRVDGDGQGAMREERFPMTRGEHLPQVWDRVFGLDGREVGQVVLLGEWHFDVITAAGLVRLPADVVFTRTGTRVTLICNSHRTPDYALSGAPDGAGDAPSAPRETLPAGVNPAA